jgi:gliding motility-associated-like protein
MSGLAEGPYVFRLVNECGLTSDLSVIIPPFQPASPSYYMFPGCANNEGSLKVRVPDKIMHATLMAAPSGYPIGVPQNLDTQCIAGDFYFGPVQSGLYTFRFTNQCGKQYTRYVSITGLQVTQNDIQINKICGSFSILLNHTSNATGVTFWLQKWNSTNNNWEHPQSQIPYTPNTEINFATGLPIANNTLVGNLQFSGHFRIVKQYSYNLGNRMLLCAEPIKEFDVELKPVITAVVPFSCNTGLNRDVQIQVIGGKAPLLYRIISHNNIPNVVQNGQNALFTNLSPGQYVFEVEDACGEKRQVVYDITLAVSLQVTPSDFCPGQPAQLSVPNYSFLQYRWYKTTAPTITLSTTSQLAFNPFNAAVHGGSYAVQITNVASLSSCTNTTLLAVVPSDVSAPQAGFDNQAAFCGRPGILNLNTYLSGTYSANGSWLLNTQPLGSANWNTAGLAFDNYTLVYRVNGFCNQFDEAQITINLKAIPDTPVASAAAPSVCVGSVIQLQSSTVPNANYHWEGPNTFTSTDQNPQIANAQVAQSGTYTVYTEWQGCKSVNATVAVNVQSQVIPQAGLGVNKELCGAPNQMDLFQQLSGTFSNNGNWLWTDNGQTVANGVWNSNTAGWGIFHFTYTVNGICAPAAQSNVEITLKPLPATPLLNLVPTQVCVGNAVQATIQTQTGDTYVWTGPGNLNLSAQNTYSIAQAQLNDAGDFHIQTERNGCFSPMISQTLQVNPNPEAKLDGLCLGSQFRLGAYPINQSYDPTQVSYSWTGPDQFSGNQQEFLLNGGTPGMYEVKITTASQCFTVLTEKFESLACAIPKGVSPNNDGKNDTFDLTSFTIVPKVEIFNRYGTKVYWADQYTDQWHGQDYNDRLLPSGTYYYYIELLSGEKRTGWVYLLY